jgi:short-subunit dehydrogenase
MRRNSNNKESNNKGDMADKGWALITGGSSGIGRCYAEQLAEQGYNILTISNREEENNLVAEEIAARYGVRAIALHKDLSDPDSAYELHDYCTHEGL